MCLIIFAYKAVPGINLVVAANRDELFTRPSAQAGFWSTEGAESEILGGRDLQAHGTWLGLTKSGRFAAVTNIRDPLQREAKPKSRGELTRLFLSSSIKPNDYFESLKTAYQDYAGFNLLVGDEESLWYVNNFENLCEPLPPGVYGLSNGILNSPWPKILDGKAKLVELLTDVNTLTTDNLISMMRDTKQAADHLLPDTGVPLELERLLSSAFISNPQRDYGTRCSTAAIMEASGNIRFSEQNYDQSGAATQRHYYELQPLKFTTGN